MKLLEDRILRDSKVIGSDTLKVDGFLNHQIDVELLDKLGKEFARLFSDTDATKILTVEASGIALACAAARYMKVPVVFAKKGMRKNVGNDVYTAASHSFTHNTDYIMTVSKEFISANDKVLIIDDFLADGNAVSALLSIIRNAGAKNVGIGVAIEKGFQHGGKFLRQQGCNLRSLAIIESMGDAGIVFRHEDC